MFKRVSTLFVLFGIEQRAELLGETLIVGVDQLGGAVERDLRSTAQEIAKWSKILLILLQTVKLVHALGDELIKFSEC
ncbi:hypothetical protein BH09CHL1_BH09CHL1_12730 [soil metagenome]